MHHVHVNIPASLADLWVRAMRGRPEGAAFGEILGRPEPETVTETAAETETERETKRETETERHSGDDRDGRAEARAAARALSALTERTVRAGLRRAEVDDDAEVSVTFCDDDEIARLNAEYLGHDGPTDVISFPLHAEGEPPLGDVYIGFAQALRNAAEYEVAPTEEIVRLAAHGTLHLLGWDHPQGEERERTEMWAIQESVVREVVGQG